MIVSLLLSDDIDIVTLQNGAPQNKHTHTLIANNMKDWNRDQKRWQSGEGGGGGEGAPQTQLNVCFAAEQR